MFLLRFKTRTFTSCFEYCYKNAAMDYFTLGFESACEVLSALLAFLRVAVEVLRRAMEKVLVELDKVKCLE